MTLNSSFYIVKGSKLAPQTEDGVVLGICLMLSKWFAFSKMEDFKPEELVAKINENQTES